MTTSTRHFQCTFSHFLTRWDFGADHSGAVHFGPLIELDLFVGPANLFFGASAKQKRVKKMSYSRPRGGAVLVKEKYRNKTGKGK